LILWIAAIGLYVHRLTNSSPQRELKSKEDLNSRPKREKLFNSKVSVNWLN